MGRWHGSERRVQTCRDDLTRRERKVRESKLNQSDSEACGANVMAMRRALRLVTKQQGRGRLMVRSPIIEGLQEHTSLFISHQRVGRDWRTAAKRLCGEAGVTIKSSSTRGSWPSLRGLGKGGSPGRRSTQADQRGCDCAPWWSLLPSPQNQEETIGLALSQ